MDILADKQLKADFAASGGELTPKEIRLGLKFIF